VWLESGQRGQCMDRDTTALYLDLPRSGRRASESHCFPTVLRDAPESVSEIVSDRLHSGLT
jgi:hypothetical protein